MGYSLTPPPPSLLHHPTLNPHLTRRSLLLLSTATTTTRSLPPSPSPSPSLSATTTPQTPSPTITDRVFMDFSLCPNYFLPNRTLGDNLATLCSDSTPLGRLVLGLYGNLVPLTVSNFKSMCLGANSTGSSYKNTLVHKIFPGRYFLAGRQGRPDKGEVRPPHDLARNTETVDAKAFALTHSGPGIVSLSLSENDDEDEIKLDPGYRNVEFLITTGPGPCPDLDNKNIVFGTVLEGLDVVTAIASIPTYQPSERIRQFNDLAEFFGDERAQNARAIWNRPLTTVYISDCGELKVEDFVAIMVSEQSLRRRLLVKVIVLGLGKHKSNHALTLVAHSCNFCGVVSVQSPCSAPICLHQRHNEASSELLQWSLPAVFTHFRSFLHVWQ